MAKKLNAIDQAYQDQGVSGFQLTDDILITPPSRKQAELIQKTDDPEMIMKIVLGSQYDAAKEVLENLPMAVEMRVMEAMLKALTEDLPSVDDVITRLGLEGADAADIVKKVTAAQEQ